LNGHFVECLAKDFLCLALFSLLAAGSTFPASLLLQISISSTLPLVFIAFLPQIHSFAFVFDRTFLSEKHSVIENGRNEAVLIQPSTNPSDLMVRDGAQGLGARYIADTLITTVCDTERSQGDRNYNNTVVVHQPGQRLVLADDNSKMDQAGSARALDL
jgi:hypothetical protein